MTTKAKVKPMPKAELDALVAKLRGPVRQTWEVIGGDTEAACAEDGTRLTNAMAVEVSLDANYMSMYGGAEGKAADKALADACKAGHYTQIFRRMCKELRLA